MKTNAYAVIMAGGDGERFWPLSTPKRPKQFVDIFGGKPLIRHAFDRLRGLIPPLVMLVSAGMMGVCALALKKLGWRWMNDYALPISLLVGMLSAIPITALLA